MEIVDLSNDAGEILAFSPPEVVNVQHEMPALTGPLAGKDGGPQLITVCLMYSPSVMLWIQLPVKMANDLAMGIEQATHDLAALQTGQQ